MKITLKENTPIYKHYLRRGTNWWIYASFTGLLGILLTGADVHTEGTSFNSYSVSINLNGIAQIFLLVWIIMICFAIKSNKRQTQKYCEAITKNPEFLEITETGVSWGVVDIHKSDMKWSIISHYCLRKNELELGLPGTGLAVNLSKLNNFDKDEFIDLMKQKYIKKID